jgi:hypothetical protein
MVVKMVVTRIDEAWIGIWDAIYDIVNEFVDSGDLKVAYQGLKFPPDKLPCAMVGAGETPIGVINTLGTERLLKIPIYIFTQESDLVIGLKSAITLAGKIEEQLVADRQLGLPYVENLEAITIATSPRDVPPGFERNCVKIDCTVRFYLDGV